MFEAISAAAALFGTGLSLFGTSEASADAAKAAAISGNIAQLQIQENAVRQQAMTLSYQRQSIEVARNTEKARANNLASAVQGGAQFSSGAAGGQAQAQSAGAFQLGGLSQNFQLGTKMFSLDSSIDQQKIALAQVQGQEASAQGLMGLGQGISSAGFNFMKMFNS